MESYESLVEEETQRHNRSKKRAKIFGALLIIAIIARIYIKNPPPPPKPIHPPKTMKVLPGMLARLPVLDRAKLSPTLLAQLQEADQMRSYNSSKKPEAYVQGRYKPAEAPMINPDDLAAQQKEKFAYLKKLKSIETAEEPSLSMERATIVKLKNGRYIRARRAEEKGKECLIEVNSSLFAKLPAPQVQTVLYDMPNYTEPVPEGFVELKPARGISIQVAKNISKRISIPKENENNDQTNPS